MGGPMRIGVSLTEPPPGPGALGKLRDQVTAADEAGRPAPRVVCTLPICVTDDPAAARERANEVFSIYGQLPSYRAMLDLEGAAGPGDVAIVGDEDAVGRQVAGLGEAGVTDFVAASFGQGEDGERTRALLRG